MRSARHQSARPSGQFFHQLGIAAGAAYAVQTAQPGEDCLHFRRGQYGAVHAVAIQNGDAAAHALRGGDGDARPAQGFDVPLDCPAGHLEVFCKLRRGDPVLLEQQGQNTNQPIHFHCITAFAAFVCIIS